MLFDFVNGQTSVVLRVKLRDSSVTTGAGLTGLTSASSGLIISTIADNEATPTVYTVAASHVQTITTLGTYAAPSASNCRFKEVDATNHPGTYELQIADARFAVSGAKSLMVSVSGAANLVQTDAVVPLRAVNPYDAVRFGLTSLPNVAQGSTGCLPIGNAAGQVTAVGGRIEKNTALANFPFVMVLTSDHVTGATGKTVTAQRSINGAAFASTTNSPTELASGVYLISLSAADLNGDTITLMFTATSCDARIITLVTQTP